MRRLFPIFVAGVLLAPAVLAEPSAGGERDVPALIKQLGDDDPKIREEASQTLHRMGQGALPALSEATKSPDPEVVSRAQTLIRQIDEDLHPKPVAPDDLIDRMRIRRMQALQPQAMQPQAMQPQAMQRIQAIRVNSQRSVSIKRNAAGEMVKDITVSEAGRTVKIHESPDGIAIKTTVAGQVEAAVVEAKDKAELKKEHPAEFALYEKYSGAGDGRLEGAAAMRLDLLDAQRADLERARLTLEQRKLVEDRLGQIQERMRQLRKELDEPKETQEQMRDQWQQLLQKPQPKPQQQQQQQQQ
jgi:hypothetical protein